MFAAPYSAWVVLLAFLALRAVQVSRAQLPRQVQAQSQVYLDSLPPQVSEEPQQMVMESVVLTHLQQWVSIRVWKATQPGIYFWGWLPTRQPSSVGVAPPTTRWATEVACVPENARRSPGGGESHGRANDLEMLG